MTLGGNLPQLLEATEGVQPHACGGGGCSQPLQARVLNPNFVSRAPSLCSSPYDPHLLRPLLVPTSHRFNPKS